MGVAGPVSMEHPTVGAALLWKHILGAIATSTPVGATDARDHEATLGTLNGKFLTGQVGRPRVNNDTPKPYDYIGLKVASASLSQSVGGFLTIEVALDGYDEDTGQTLATASYAADLGQFFFDDCTLSLDDGGGAATYAADDFNLSIDNGLATDRRKLRGDTRKLEQIEATTIDGRNITGSAASDFDGGSISDLYSDGTEFELIATWAHPVEIEAGFNYELEVTLPRCRADSGSATVSGPGIVSQPLGFKVLKPASDEPITVRLRDSLTAP
jgi:hypothetical protein